MLCRALLLLSLVAPALAGPPVASAEPAPPPAAEAGAVEPAAEAPAEAAAEKVATPPQPIPAADIPVRAEALAQLLTAYRNRLAAKDEIERIAAALAELDPRLDRDLMAQVEHPPVDEPLLVIEDLASTWTRRKARLEGWGATLRERALELGAIEQELTDEHAVWMATAAVPGLPDVLRERIDASLERIAEAQRRVQERLAPLLALQGHLSRRVTDVGDALQVVERASTERRQNLLRIEATPLWSMARQPERLTLWREVSGAVESRGRALVEYLESRGASTVAQLLLFLVLVVVLKVRAAHPVPSDPQDAGMRVASLFLARPVSAALAIALLTAPALHRDSPTVFRDLVGVLSLLPVARFLPALVPAAWGRWVYALLLVFVLDRLERFAVSGSTLQRLLSCLADLAAGGWVLGFRRVLRGQGERWPRWMRFLRHLTGLGFVVVGLSLVANLVGAVSVASLLGHGIVVMLYSGGALYVAGRALDALLAMIGHAVLVQRLAAFRHHGTTVAYWRTRLVRLLALWLWCTVTLKVFMVYDPIIAWAKALLSRDWGFGSISISLGDVLVFAVAVWVSVLASRLTRFVLEDDVLPRLSLPPGVPATISMLVHYAIIVLGVLVAVSAAGLQLSQLTLIAGGLGVGIGLGLQSLVNNFVSGLILIFERPLKIGDTVEIGTMIGTVRQIGIRASVVGTFDGAEVIVPNGNLLAGEMTNWTLSDRRRRIEIPVGVAYGTDPEVVIELLVQVARGHAKVLPEPAPVALFMAFGASSLDFSLRAWTDEFDDWPLIRSDLAVAIHRALREADIEIPFPQQDLHLRSITPRAGGILGAIRESPGRAPRPDPPEPDPD